MKKQLKLVLIISVVALALCACGESTSVNPTKPVETKVVPTVVATQQGITNSAIKSEVKSEAPQTTVAPVVQKSVDEGDKYGIKEQLSPPKKGERIAIMTTSLGTIKIKFFPNEAPKAVENFITHSGNGYFNGLKFHRILNNFMIQGGDPQGDGMGGESIWGKKFDDEFSPLRHNFRGALSMANSGVNSNGSQFFIVQKKDMTPDDAAFFSSRGVENEVAKKYMEIGGTGWLDNKHTVFGQVFEGLDIVDKIAGVEMANLKLGIPKEPVLMKKVEIVTWDK